MAHEYLIEDLVAANRILASEKVCDAFGHVSVRHPDKPDRYLLSCARSPELIEAEHIMEFALDGTPVGASDVATGKGGKPYLERFIHGAIYEKRPEINAVVHSHSHSVLPFTVTETRLRPMVHSCATIGHEVPVWDAQDSFGDTALLVANMDMGRDLATVIGDGPSALMRGHGSTVVGRSLREVIYTAIYLEVNAGLQLDAARLGAIKFLTAGEVDLIRSRLADGKPGEGYDRAWEYWCRHAGIAARKLA